MEKKPGSKPERDRLRRTMQQTDCTPRQIVDEMARRWHFRPRAAWRFACGMTQEEAAERCNTLREDDRAAISGKRISEYELWPQGGTRPSVTTLALLGRAYGVRADDLLDGQDRAALPASYLREAQDQGDLFDLRGSQPGHAPGDNGARLTDHGSRLPAPPITPATLAVSGAVAHRLMPTEEASFMAAAHESSEHAGRAEASNVGPALLESLHDQTRRLARELVYTDAMLLFPDMIRARDRIYRVLEGHQHPRQTRELYFLAAVVCCLLAEASQSYGLRGAALEQTRAAWAYAELAGHDSIRAWCRSAQSWHAYRDGRPREAAALAASAQQYARGNPASQQRLHSMEGTAWALAGDEPAAVSAFRAATEERERIHAQDDFFDEVGGVFVADAPKQFSNEANGMIVLGRVQDAARCARVALALYADAPFHQRDTALEPAARVTLATATVLGGDLEAAAAELHPVLVMEPALRSDVVVEKLREFNSHLRPYARRALPRVTELQAQIEQFRLPSLPGGAL